MCGIVGIVGKSQVAERIIKSLKLLEYRGYDSAGIAVTSGEKIEYFKALGKINKLSGELKKFTVKSNVGIGHTRWATHGKPSKENAHPMVVGDVAVVHNGIIENHNELRKQLISQGYKFSSSTDTETIPALIDSFLRAGNSIKDSLKLAYEKLEGAFAIAILHNKNPEKIFCMKKGAPLAIGIGKGENYLGSDALALSPYTKQVVYLEDGDMAEVDKNSYQIFSVMEDDIKRHVKMVSDDSSDLSLGKYPHFMLKEIFEQPKIINQAFRKYWDIEKNDFKVKNLDFSEFDHVYVIACGTSYNAAAIFKYWLEKFAKINVEIDIASEFRYRHTPFRKNAAAIFISQSGETADTLAAMKHCKEKGLHTVAVINVIESSMANLADRILPIFAGHEIGVASTKAFLAQLLVLCMVTLATAKKKGMIESDELLEYITSIELVPENIHEILELSDEIKFMAKIFSDASSMIFMGRGVSFPTALEGALKMKELSYIHAEGIAAGELKHGPIALIDEKCPVVVICPADELMGKTESNAYEVFARSGRLIIITDFKNSVELKNLSSNIITIPKTNDFTSPIYSTVVTQMFSYHTAVDLGKDVDQPRNLAKSVTVE